MTKGRLLCKPAFSFAASMTEQVRSFGQPGLEFPYAAEDVPDFGSDNFRC